MSHADLTRAVRLAGRAAVAIDASHEVAFMALDQDLCRLRAKKRETFELSSSVCDVVMMACGGAHAVARYARQGFDLADDYENVRRAMGLYYKPERTPAEAMQTNTFFRWKDHAAEIIERDFHAILHLAIELSSKGILTGIEVDELWTNETRQRRAREYARAI